LERGVSLSHKKAGTHINLKVVFGDEDNQIPIDETARKTGEYRQGERAIK